MKASSASEGEGLMKYIREFFSSIVFSSIAARKCDLIS